MPPTYSPHIRNIAVDLILTLLTCGLFNLYVQHQQIAAVNDMIKQNKYNFWMWLFFCIITCSLYHFYHEYCIGEDITRVRGKVNDNLSIITIILLVCGLTFIVDAIQQSEINAYYGNNQL